MQKPGNRQFRDARPSAATAIPPRASAHAGKAVQPGSRYAQRDHLSIENDITRIPTIPERVSRVIERNTPPPIDDLVDRNTIPMHVSPDISCRDTIEHARVTYTQYMDGAKSGFAPLERIRWWLLYPGRIEFLILAGGTLLLLGITTLLVLVMTLSLGIIN